MFKGKSTISSHQKPLFLAATTVSEIIIICSKNMGMVLPHQLQKIQLIVLKQILVPVFRGDWTLLRWEFVQVVIKLMSERWLQNDLQSLTPQRGGCRQVREMWKDRWPWDRIWGMMTMMTVFGNLVVSQSYMFIIDSFDFTRLLCRGRSNWVVQLPKTNPAPAPKSLN